MRTAITLVFVLLGSTSPATEIPLVEYSSRVDNVHHSTEMSGSLSDGSLVVTWTGTADTYIAQYSGFLGYEALYGDVQPAVGAYLDLSQRPVPYQILIDNPDGLEYAVVAYTLGMGEGPVFQLEQFGTDTTAEYSGVLEQCDCTGAFGVLLQGDQVAVDVEIQLRMDEAMPNGSDTLDSVKALYR